MTADHVGLAFGGPLRVVRSGFSVSRRSHQLLVAPAAPLLAGSGRRAVVAHAQKAKPAAMASMVSTPRGRKMWLSMNE